MTISNKMGVLYSITWATEEGMESKRFVIKDFSEEWANSLKENDVLHIKGIGKLQFRSLTVWDDRIMIRCRKVGEYAESIAAGG